MYKLVKWHNATQRYQSPPLHNDDDSIDIQDPHAKAQILYRKLLCRHLDVLDIPPDTPTVSQRDIPWEQISITEAYRATCQVTSSCPGKDELTAMVLRKAWPVLGQKITHFFNACIRLGTHPRTFKTANVVIIPKPGKRNRKLPKSYRPISLLSCLGKGLERLVARRISYWM